MRSLSPILAAALILSATSLTQFIHDRPVSAQVPHGTQYEETPAGVLDGQNDTFTIQFQPLPWAAIKLYRNGSRLKRGRDYILTGPNHTQIVFQKPCGIMPPPYVDLCLPIAGDTLLTDYTY